ncbi:uncharacterized protein E0L32_006595 [Thyridium curvatum]|uniref:Cerato-platanin n=1 Tax=Thyridium curvatum TaxID=1093900 RepID=A0A507B8I7_9PEZI|nr:uncharacterized protein E0L32_006595 [Thyridium curvatum]TPX12950.1 hypothetical protein E0L32_006595 [Thyridium curvatum]
MRPISTSSVIATALSLSLPSLLLLFPTLASAETVWATPHESYSSSVGVLGCKIDTDRVAYWPASVDCDNICVSLSYEGRTLYLLRIDQSGGAHDVSYDAWNTLVTGASATKDPTAGGAIAMETENVPVDKCKPLLNKAGGKFPLSASNSMNFLASCLTDKPDSFVAKNYQLYNIQDPICTWGIDEKCTLDWPERNQATCPKGLGTPSALTDAPVWNVQYPTGKHVLAGAPPEAPAAGTPGTAGASKNAAGRARRLSAEALGLSAAVVAYSLLYVL